jgi:hypothetical protein
LVVGTPEADLFEWRLTGEKKGDLPCDKAPLMSLGIDQSNLTVTFFEALNTSSGVDQFLFAGIKRVAGSADLGVDLFFCGTCQECITAQALNGNLGIFWVDAFFHVFLLHSALRQNVNGCEQ